MNAPAGTTVADIGEFALIELIRARLDSASSDAGSQLIIGPGDDAAEIPAPGGSFLISSDLLIEGRHFRRDWSSAEDVGRKAAAANLSDINAMGGTATALTVSLGVPGDLAVDWVLQFADGLAAECAVVGAEIAGGDVTASEAIVVAVSAVGQAAKAIRRDTAAAGDTIAYAGVLGLAGAGFAALSRGFRSPRAAVDAHRVPTPPYGAGPQAAAAGATSLIDVSDGLLADLGHIARSSGVVVELESDSFPIIEWVGTVAEALGSDPLRFVLTGGDDYALVGSFDADVPEGWTRIGVARHPALGEEPGVLVDGAPYEGAPGHQHFR
ncbi:MAG TPA: thiamine-phosphate kinase [Aeromicrobium sp.]|nr:thiamine-phosphate kinase [Aeromicrobium sp.]